MEEIEEWDIDGIADENDIDNDNDGILDYIECGATINSLLEEMGGSTKSNPVCCNMEGLFDIDYVDTKLPLRLMGGLNTNNEFQLEGTAGAGEVLSSLNPIILTFLEPWLANSNGLPRLRILTLK